MLGRQRIMELLKFMAKAYTAGWKGKQKSKREMFLLNVSYWQYLYSHFLTEQCSTYAIHKTESQHVFARMKNARAFKFFQSNDGSTNMTSVKAKTKKYVNRPVWAVIKI